MSEEAALRRASRRGPVDEWLLVLGAEGIPARVRSDDGGFALWVAQNDVARADAALLAYEQENPPPAPEPARRAVPGAGVAWGVPLALLAFFSATGPRDPDVVWFARGSADAARILDGELWRTVTALTLHADLAHVLANVFFGAVFLTGAVRALGPGVALALVIAAGIGGNFVNAWIHGAGHVSVGASTSVFGAVGLLGGAGAVREHRSGTRGRRVLIPVAASLGLLAMLGAGPEVDLWAHLFGLFAGAMIGVIAGRRWPEAPGTFAQIAWGIAAAVTVLGAWSFAGIGPLPR